MVEVDRHLLGWLGAGIHRAVFIVAIVAASGVDAGSVPSAHEERPPSEKKARSADGVFGPAEQTIYDLTILGAGAGSMRMDVGAAATVEGVAAWPLVAQIKSNGPVNAVFPVRDYLVSWWDPERGRSVASRLSASEGQGRYGNLIRMHRDEVEPDGKFLATVEHWDGKHRETVTQVLDADTEDLLAAIFWLRTRPLAVGDHETVPVYMGRAEWPLGAVVTGAAPVHTAAGTFSCVHVLLTTHATGSLASQKEIQLDFTNDHHHFMVAVDIELRLGHARAELTQLHPGR